MASATQGERRDLAKVILFYAFTPIADPEAIRLWQRDLCESLGLKGRILISAHGINGTLGGAMSARPCWASAVWAAWPVWVA